MSAAATSLNHGSFKRTGPASVCVCVSAIDLNTPVGCTSLELTKERRPLRNPQRLLFRKIHACIPRIVWFCMIYTVYVHTRTDTHHTSEVSSHLFVQAVELLPVLQSGSMWHGPVTWNSSHGGHPRRGSRPERQTVFIETPGKT